MLTASDIDRLKSSIDKWGMALVNELQLFREAFVANNMSICESCANNPCNKKAMLGDRRIYECTLYERAEQTEPNCSEKPNNCEPKIVDWGKRKPCMLELFDDDGNYIEPKDEPQTDCAWK